MRSLNDLTKQERLELYRKALKDWEERPNDYEAKTMSGLCRYMKASQEILAYESYSDLCDEWVKHVQSKCKGMSSYLAETCEPIPRIAALKAMIVQLEEEML